MAGNQRPSRSADQPSLRVGSRAAGSATAKTGEAPKARGRRGRPASAHAGSLIDWHEPERNAHVLDWRQRAHEFGLLPVASQPEDEEAIPMPIADIPERLLHDEEPESLEDQTLDEGEEEPAPKELEEPPEAGVSSEEPDLVRVYLKHIGKRKLLKAEQEQEIGKRMERT